MTVTGEMFAGSGHSGLTHSVNKGFRQADNRITVIMKTAITDGFTSMSEIQNRGKAQIDIQCAHFRRHQPTCFFCSFLLFKRIRNQCRKCLHRRQTGKPFAKTLHPTAFLIDGNQQRFFHPLTHGFHQGLNLCAIIEITAKQN